MCQLGFELVENIKSTDQSLALPESVQLNKISDFTEEIRKHPGFVWLNKKAEFKEALQLFEEEIRKIEDSEIAIARMRIRFFHAIAGSGWQLLSESSWIPQTISKKEKGHAVKIASELLTYVIGALGRPDYPVMKGLEKPLRQFIKQIQTETKTEYKGPDYRQKEIAINFALCLRDFGLKKSKVVELLESSFSIFKVDLGHRTAQSYVREGFER